MPTISLSLSEEETEFLQRWAEQRNVTVPELVRHWVQLVQTKQQPHPDLAIITGIVPDHIDVQDEYHRYLLSKLEVRPFFR